MYDPASLGSPALNSRMIWSEELIFGNPLEDSRPGLAWLEPQNAPKTDPWLAPRRPLGGPKASLLAGPRLAFWLAPWLAVHVLELAVQHVNSRMIRLPEPLLGLSGTCGVQNRT